MRGTIQRLIAAAVLGVCIGAPFLEMGDRWDATLQNGNDTECNLIGVVLCVGLASIGARLVLRHVALPAAPAYMARPSVVLLGIVAPVVRFRPLLEPSPPLVLRV